MPKYKEGMNASKSRRTKSCNECYSTDEMCGHHFKAKSRRTRVHNKNKVMNNFNQSSRTERRLEEYDYD